MDKMDITANSLKISKLVILKFRMSKKYKKEKKDKKKEEEEKKKEKYFKKLIQNVDVQF